MVLVRFDRSSSHSGVLNNLTVRIPNLGDCSLCPWQAAANMGKTSPRTPSGAWASSNTLRQKCKSVPSPIDWFLTGIADKKWMCSSSQQIGSGVVFSGLQVRCRFNLVQIAFHQAELLEWLCSYFTVQKKWQEMNSKVVDATRQDWCDLN